MFQILEKRIIGILRQLENGKTTTLESGILSLLERMRSVDEPAYDQLSQRYNKTIRQNAIR